MERTSSAKLDKILGLQKSAFDRTGLGYDFSSPSIASNSNTVFVPTTDNIETENNNIKSELASENIDKGKSILGVPPKLDKKEIKNPRLRRETLKSQNRKSSISVISVGQLDILDLIAIEKLESVSIIFCSL